MKILIGQNYKNEFDSICSLLDSKRPCPAFDKNPGIASYFTDDGKKAISFNENTFIYDHTVSTAQYESGENSEKLLGFTKDGATWFSKLRGSEAIDSADTIWANFMSEISRIYHKKYSIVEYYQNPEKQRVVEEDARNRAERALKVILGNDGLTLDSKNFKNISQKNADNMDVYILYLRLAVGYGSTEPKTVLGNVCLQRENKDAPLLPLSCDEASEVMKLFALGSKENGNQIPPQENSTAGDNTTARALYNSASAVLQNMVEGTQTNTSTLNFADYLHLDESEEIIINNLLNLTAHDSDVLECRKVELLSITHILWSNTVFNYCEGDVPKMRFVFGLNRLMTVKCLNCNENIVTRNIFTVKATESELEACIDICNDYLTSDVKKRITKQFNEEHLVLIQGCSKSPAIANCKRVRCPSSKANQCFEYDGRWYCNDCGKPEIVCYDENLKPFPTANAVFSITRKEMVPYDKEKGDVAKCSKCNRYFDNKTTIRSTTCPLCGAVDRFLNSVSNTKPSIEDIRKRKKLYKTYAKTVPVHCRANTKTKVAFEDSEIVLIVIGRKVYKFDKLFPLDSKLVPSAKQLKQFKKS